MRCLLENDNMGMRLREQSRENMTAFSENGKTEKTMILWKHWIWR